MASVRSGPLHLQSPPSTPPRLLSGNSSASTAPAADMDSASYTSPTEEIRLKRGKRGLGFNIVGGTDHQYNYNDSAIYVSKIKEDGPADADGRLKEGDQILAINGQVLCDMTHLEVVEVFRNSGDEVVLQVVKKIRDKNNQSNGPTISPLVLTALVVVVAIFGYVKYRHRS